MLLAGSWSLCDLTRAADGVRLGAGARAVEIRYAGLGLRAPDGPPGRRALRSRAA
jgi:hypothetical protein